MVQDIHKLLSEGERVTLECKKATKGVPNSLWDTYSAFANTYGGTILLGEVVALLFFAIGCSHHTLLP